MRKIFNVVALFAWLVSLTQMQAQNYWGSGSRDLYKADTPGNRAWMMSTLCDACVFNPFATYGRTMVYAKAGETIYVGSSVQGMDGGTIRLYPPTGVGASSNKYYTTGSSTTIGRIQNRAEELKGPAVSFNPNGSGGYNPYAQLVKSNETGIWIIEFIPRDGTTPPGDTGQTQIIVKATDEWQTNQTSVVAASAFIAAWDVSVGNGTNFLSGRTYTNTFNGSIFPTVGGTQPDGFYGKFYALTKDGFIYEVDNNGQNGLSFNFFVNNKGVRKAGTQDASYLSFNSSTYANISSVIWDPRKLDDTENITHKIFYGKPATDMPAEAKIFHFYPGNTSGDWDMTGSTGAIKDDWLRPVRVNPQMSDLSFIGSEGTPSQSGSKGGFITYESNVDGFYEITIPFSSGAGYTNRVLRGPAIIGTNRIYWDGYDGSTPAKKVGSGVSFSSVTTQLSGAEVHFPLIDVENNPNGIKIQLLDNNRNLYSPTKDIVYWDNTGITLNGTNPPLIHRNITTTGGASSTGNGHKWGIQNTNVDNFGNNKTIDTWSYAPGEQQTINGIVIDIKEMDLKVNYLTTSPLPNEVELGVGKNQNMSYSIEIENVGTIDAVNERVATFFFYLPLGVTITQGSVVFSSSTGATLNGTATVTALPSNNMYKVEVNMPANSKAIFTIPAVLTAATPTGKINAWAGIMRNSDVSDPNASNPDYINIPHPRDPFEEANGIHKRVDQINLNVANVATAPDFTNLSIVDVNNANYTNNIKYNNQVTSKNIASTVLGIVKTGSKTADTGGTATFSITVTNNGTSVSTNTILTDNLSGTRYNFSNTANYLVTQGSVSYTPGTTAGKGIITWNIGTLAVGATATINFTTATNTTGGSSFTNTASVSSNEAPPASSSITLSANTTATDFQIVKSVSNHADADKVVFRLSVSRVPTTGVASTLNMSDLLPSGYEYVSATASLGTVTYSVVNGTSWSLNVPVDNTSTGTNPIYILDIVARIKQPTGANNEYLNNGYIINSTVPETDLTNNKSSAEIKSDLEIKKTVDDSYPLSGKIVVFTLQAKNLLRNGSYNHSTGVKITDALPSGFTYVSHTTPTQGVFTFDTNTKTGTWKIDNFANNTDATVTIRAKVNSTGTYTNSAFISGGYKDDNLLNNVSTITLVPARMLITNPMIYQKTK